MTCDQSRARLSEHLDQCLDAAGRAALEAHLATCSSCAAELRALQTLREGLQRMEPIDAPADMLQGVREKLSAGARPKFAWPTSRLPALQVAGVVLASALALAIGLPVLNRELNKMRQPGELLITNEPIHPLYQHTPYQDRKSPSRTAQYEPYYSNSSMRTAGVAAGAAMGSPKDERFAGRRSMDDHWRESADALGEQFATSSQRAQSPAPTGALTQDHTSLSSSDNFAVEGQMFQSYSGGVTNAQPMSAAKAASFDGHVAGVDGLNVGKNAPAANTSSADAFDRSNAFVANALRGSAIQLEDRASGINGVAVMRASPQSESAFWKRVEPPARTPIRLQWAVADRATAVAGLRQWTSPIPNAAISVDGDRLTLSLPASVYPELLKQLARDGAVSAPPEKAVADVQYNLSDSSPRSAPSPETAANTNQPAPADTSAVTVEIVLTAPSP